MKGMNGKMMKKKAQLTTCIEHRHYGDEVVTMMNNTEVCLNCGKPLKYHPNKEKRRNRGYCCLDCYYTKPPKFAYVEYVIGVPVLDYILQELDRCDNITKVADLLGVTRQTLTKFLTKHHIIRTVQWRKVNG